MRFFVGTVWEAVIEECAGKMKTKDFVASKTARGHLRPATCSPVLLSSEEGPSAVTLPAPPPRHPREEVPLAARKDIWEGH